MNKPSGPCLQYFSWWVFDNVLNFAEFEVGSLESSDLYPCRVLSYVLTELRAVFFYRVRSRVLSEFEVVLSGFEFVSCQSSKPCPVRARNHVLSELEAISCQGSKLCPVRVRSRVVSKFEAISCHSSKPYPIRVRSRVLSRVRSHILLELEAVSCQSSKPCPVRVQSCFLTMLIKHG